MAVLAPVLIIAGQIVIAVIAAVVATITGLILVFQNWGAICEWFCELWNKNSEGISTMLNLMGGLISKILTGIKDCFSFEWRLPKIKLPHFKITDSLSLSPPSVPSLSIE